MLLNRRVCSGLVGVVAGLLTVVPVPAQAAELTEVTVRRTLFRTGETEMAAGRGSLAPAGR